MGVSNPNLRPDHTAQGSSTGEIKPHNLCKKQWGLGHQEKKKNCQSPRRVHLRGPQGPRTYANPPTLETTIGVAARRATVSYRTEVK